MRVVVNSTPEDDGEVGTVADLLRDRAVMPERVAVELNRELVTRDRYATTTLTEGDHVEIVTFVGFFTARGRDRVGCPLIRFERAGEGPV